jgi:hypothetical protein
MPDENLLIVDLTNKEINNIFSKISIAPSDPLGQCWAWNGETIPGGYGRIKYRGRRECTHRLLYAWLIHPLLRGHGKGILELDHIACDNKNCCNPWHVELVTHKENVLRSPSPTTENSKKIYCKRGHLLPDKPNNKLKTKRYCKECLKEYGKERYRLKHAQVRL